MMYSLLCIWSILGSRTVLIIDILGWRTSSATLTILPIPETLYKVTAAVGIVHPQPFVLKLLQLFRSQSWSPWGAGLTSAQFEYEPEATYSSHALRLTSSEEEQELDIIV